MFSSDCAISLLKAKRDMVTIMYLLLLVTLLYGVEDVLSSPVVIRQHDILKYKPGILGMYYNTYRLNDFAYNAIKHEMPHFPNQPNQIKHFDKFQGMYKMDANHIARNVAYFIAPVSGSYTFHLVCKAKCQIRFTSYGCHTDWGWSTPHIVTSNKGFNGYEDSRSLKPFTMSAKYRYCIEVLQKASASVDNWIGVGVTYPNGTKEIPMVTTFHVPDLVRMYQVTHYYAVPHGCWNNLAKTLAIPDFPNGQLESGGSSLVGRHCMTLFAFCFTVYLAYYF